MPISPAGRANKLPPRRPAPRGVTLIELLVVVSILAVLSLGVGLGAGGLFAGPSGASQAERLQDGFQALRDRAVLGRHRLGLVPRRDGWLVVARDAEGAWQAQGAPLALAGATLVWEIAGRPFLPRLVSPDPRDEPPVQLAPDGASTPFGLLLQQGNARQRCRAPLGAPLSCEGA